MRITIVLGAFLPVPAIMGGAVEKAWFALGQEFARRGHEVVQISRAHAKFPQDEMIEGVKHLRLRGYDQPKSLVRLKLLDLLYSRRAQAALSPSEIIVTNTFWLPMLLRKTAGVYVNVARFPKRQMRFYRNAARLQAPSRAIADAIIAEVPSLKDKVAVIPYPRTSPLDDDVRAFPEREQKIIYVGRIHPEKGVHLLLRALTSDQFSPNWKLTVIGPWEHRLGGGGESYWNELRGMAHDRVDLRGPIFEPAELAREYQSARLFVYPSLAEKGETFGLAPLEAMAQGCAVLVSNLACFRDFIREGETGFIFDHRAADPVMTLRRKIGALLPNESLLATVAEEGRRQSENFSVARVADQFLQDFEAVVKESHG